MTVCRRGLHPLRGHEGVRDRSFVLSAGPEALGRPRGCSLVALFSVIVVFVARIGNRGRFVCIFPPGPGPPGVPIPAAGKTPVRPRIAFGGIPAPRSGPAQISHEMNDISRKATF